MLMSYLPISCARPEGVSAFISKMRIATRLDGPDVGYVGSEAVFYGDAMPSDDGRASDV